MALLVQLDYKTVYIGQSPNISVAFTGDAQEWTITYEFGSHSGVIDVRSRKTDFSDFKWPLTFYNEIPTATEGKGVIIVDCYAQDAWIGTVNFPFTVLANVNGIAPTIQVPTITDANGTAVLYTGDNTKFIRYISTPAVSVSAAAWNGAYMRKVIATNGVFSAMETYHGEEKRVNFNKTLVGLESTKFTITATDSRGLNTSIAYQIAEEDLIPYVHLTCIIGNEIPETDGSIRLTCSGSYYTGSFGNSSNTLAVQYRYKESGGTYGEWQPMTISSASNNKYKAYVSLTVPDYRKAYVFECQANDAFVTATSAEHTAQALPLFHWGENDFTFEIPVKFNQGISGADVDGDQLITGNLRLKGSGNYGNTLYFGDSSYCYLKEETDDDLTIKATDLNLNVSNLYLNGGAIKAGTWTPTLTTAAAVISYSVQSGWYMRVGNAVTIGFNINASCRSGYNSTSLAISGLPFTPAANAFGGGVMFGAYVSAGFCFEAWAATTGGQITPRLQPCNNTTAGNLQIASTAYYPSGEASITLGGTITYITN